MISNIVVEKILGSILLIAGLTMIGISLYLGINVYVKAQAPPEIFKPISIQTEQATTPTAIPSSLPKDMANINPADIQKLVSNPNLFGADAMKAIIPPEMFDYSTKLMNLGVYSIFLWILITAGAKIASLGVALVKTNSDVKF